MSYRVATIEELQDIAYREDTHIRPGRHHLGISAFGTNGWTADNVGDRVMPESGVVQHGVSCAAREPTVPVRSQPPHAIPGPAPQAYLALHLGGVPWARIGEHVGQRNLAVTANTHTHVLNDEAELDYTTMLS